PPCFRRATGAQRWERWAAVAAGDSCDGSMAASEEARPRLAGALAPPGRVLRGTGSCLGVLAGVPVGLAVDDPVRWIKPCPRPRSRHRAQAVCGGDPSVFAAIRGEPY